MKTHNSTRNPRLTQIPLHTSSPQTGLRRSRRAARVEVVVIEAEQGVASLFLDGSPFANSPRSVGVFIGTIVGPNGVLEIIEVVTTDGAKRHIGSCKGRFEPGDQVQIYHNPDLNRS